VALQEEAIMSVWMKMTFAMVFLTAAMACGQSTSPTAPTPTTVSAMIANGGFTPNPINISVGSTVTWTNQDNTAHTVVADDGAFASGAIAPNGQYSYAFPAAGTFAYHDSANSNMTGTVVVSGASSGPSPY
jgi:plastocyanin